MKKLLSLFIVAGMFAFAGCGPSEEDKAKNEKETQDAIDSIFAKLDEAEAGEEAEEAEAEEEVGEAAAEEAGEQEEMSEEEE